MTTWTHSPNEESSTWAIGYPVDTNRSATGPISFYPSPRGGIGSPITASGYAIDDTFTINGGDGTAIGKVVDIIPGTGIATVVSLVYGGNGYSASQVAYGGSGPVSTTTTSGSGTGLKIDINYIDPYPIVTDWNTLYGGVWDLGSLVDWEDLDKHDWEDWN